MGDTAGLSAIIDKAIQVVTRPVEFYKNMPKAGGFADPIIFTVVMAVITGVIGALFSLLGLGPAGGMMAAGLAQIIFMPIFALIGLFIGAAILFAIWRLMGSGEPYETAFRVAAYASAIMPILALLSIIPFLGSIVNAVWGMYLMVVASMEVHGLDRKKSFIVFGVLAGLLVLMNISGEMAQRRLASHVGTVSEKMEQLGKQLEKTDDMTPEQAGEAFGKFMQGLQKAAEEAKKEADKEK